jgi:hypothetical protein
LSCIGLPRALIAQHLEQLHINHGAGIEILAAKGGLSAAECLAVLEDRPWMAISEAEAHPKLVHLVLEWHRRSGQV